MFLRLLGVHDRYGVSRLEVTGPSAVLRDPEGNDFGYVDKVELSQVRLRGSGWARAYKVRLVLGIMPTW